VKTTYYLTCEIGSTSFGRSFSSTISYFVEMSGLSRCAQAVNVREAQGATLVLGDLLMLPRPNIAEILEQHPQTDNLSSQPLKYFSLGRQGGKKPLQY
jgi:hypothetical protein